MIQLERLVLLLFVMLLPRVAWADGGTLRVSAEQHGYRISLMTSPTPLRAGPIDVSVLIQEGDTGAIAAASNVEVMLSSLADERLVVRSQATRAAATNKLCQAATLALPKPGRWRLRVVATVGAQNSS